MSTIAGAGLLLRHDLRRDRVIVPVWVASLVLMVFASAGATATLFASAAERRAVATSLDEQPALVALYGPILDRDSVGELAMSKLTVLYAVVAAVLFVVLVRRHTRVEEESGRAELVGGTATGRDAPLAAAVTECALVAAALGVLVVAAAAAGGLPLAGSLAFGVSWAGTGLVATGLAAVACQLSASARTCGSIAAGLLGGAFAARAVGDAVDGWGWLSWLSPLGWNTRLRAWSDPRWWVVLLYLTATVVLLGVAQLLRGRRDLAAGLVGARPGPADGRVAGPWGLLLRTHRTGLVLWTVGTAAMAVLFGAMIPGFDDLLAGTGGQVMVDRLGGSFVAALLPIAAMVATCFPVTVAAHATHDEQDGLLELTLATGTSRARWFAATTALTAAGGTFLVLLAGAGLAVGMTLAGSTGALDAATAAAGWLPAVWLLGAVGLLGHALRAAWVGWAALVGSLTLSLVGELLELPPALLRVSPFTAVPAYPVADWTWRSELVLTALALGVGWAAWRRFAVRDIV